MQLILSILGIFLSAILLWFNARENKSTIYLGLFFILTSLSSLHRYVVHYSDFDPHLPLYFHPDICF